MLNVDKKRASKKLKLISFNTPLKNIKSKENQYLSVN